MKFKYLTIEKKEIISRGKSPPAAGNPIPVAARAKKAVDNSFVLARIMTDLSKLNFYCGRCKSSFRTFFMDRIKLLPAIIDLGKFLLQAINKVISSKFAGLLHRVPVTLCISLIALLLLTPFLFSQTPNKIKYQGFLKRSGEPVTAQKNMIFDVYDALTGGTKL